LNKNVQKSLAEREVSVSSIADRLEKIETAYKEILKQLKTAATKSNVDELKEFISIYDPLKSSFVTRDEMERFVEDKVSRD